jgi:hypothetical protein
MAKSSDVRLPERRIHVCQMRRRIHVRQMRRRIHVCEMRRRIHVSAPRARHSQKSEEIYEKGNNCRVNVF